MPWKSRSRLRFDPQCGRPVGDQQNAYRTAKPPSEPALRTQLEVADETALVIDVSFLALRGTHTLGHQLTLEPARGKSAEDWLQSVRIRARMSAAAKSRHLGTTAGGRPLHT